MQEDLKKQIQKITKKYSSMFEGEYQDQIADVMVLANKHLHQNN